MKIAENLLKNSTYTITEVAFMSGFNNYTHFLCLFKELHNQTAGAYRKSCKNSNWKYFIAHMILVWIFYNFTHHRIIR